MVRRVDLLIPRRILFELKVARGRVGEEDRAIGQVRDYVQMWAEEGLVVLLICGIRETLECSRYARFVSELHAAGQPVIALAAGAAARGR